MFRKYFSTLNFYCRRSLSLKQTVQFDWAKQEKILLAPLDYALKMPSKYHELLAPCFNYWLQVPEQKLNAIRDVVDTMASWTVLVDDIQDNSAYRYGMPSTHQVFGVGLTINAANKAMILGQKLVEELDHPLAVQVFLKIHEAFHFGQGTDIYWRENGIIPTESEHIEIIKKKTGSYFAFPVELMQLFSSNKTDYSELANHIGTYYAMVDDYFNLFQPKALEKLGRLADENPGIQEKSFATTDIKERKMTLAIIHASQFPDVATELAYILKLQTKDPELTNRAISLIKKHGSDKYARDVLKNIEAELREEIDRLGGNPKLVSCIDDLAVY